MTITLILTNALCNQHQSHLPICRCNTWDPCLKDWPRWLDMTLSGTEQMLQITTREVQQIVPLLCLLATHANESGEQGPNVSCFLYTAAMTMQHLFRCNTELRENWVSYHLDQEWFCLSACFSDTSRQCACVCHALSACGLHCYCYYAIRKVMAFCITHTLFPLFLRASFRMTSARRTSTKPLKSVWSSWLNEQLGGHFI